MSRIPELFGPMEFYRTAQVFDDFWYYVSGDLWTSLAADSGATVAESDNHLGLVLLTTGATNNNEAAIKSSNEIFLFTDNRPITVEGALQWTEANVDDANVFFGLCSALADDTLGDDGAGPRASGSIAGFYKVDGATLWSVVSRNGSNATTNVTNVTSAGAGLIQRLTIQIAEFSGTQCQVTYFVNGVQCVDNTTLKPIVHTVLYASATEMNLGTYVKAGGSNSEVVFLDYMAGVQRGRTV